MCTLVGWREKFFFFFCLSALEKNKTKRPRTHVAEGPQQRQQLVVRRLVVQVAHAQAVRAARWRARHVESSLVGQLTALGLFCFGVFSRVPSHRPPLQGQLPLLPSILRDLAPRRPLSPSG